MVKGKRLLIVNRGEIVKRIAQTCRALGLVPVCFAALGEDHTNVLCAESIPLQGNSIRETFLNIDQIVELIKKHQIDFVHPGYGFLSENEEFAKKVQESGAKWVGPEPIHIKQMGSKIEAKLIAEKAGVTVLPWRYYEQLPDNELLFKDGDAVGYPLIVKASGGGGGKGMRIVRERDSLIESVRLCTQEAANSFKSTAILLERYIENPRHLEVQIFGDGNGGVVHFYDRECSVQRRYQKIIEEAPVFNIQDDLKQKMIQEAMRLTSFIKYRNAGTVEFVFDGQQFYFIEVNTRLQVEHSVTEMITGYDLVELQIQNAASGLMPKQSEIHRRGYAIECRICAEDCHANFLPQSGLIQKVEIPNFHQTRVDSCLFSNFDLKPYFDPMIAKVTVYDTSKEKAIIRMQELLRHTKILGIKHNVSFLQFILTTNEFLTSCFFTNSIEKIFSSKFKNQEVDFNTLKTLLQLALRNEGVANQSTQVNEKTHRPSLFEVIKL